jgi:hypothetical protein
MNQDQQFNQPHQNQESPSEQNSQQPPPQNQDQPETQPSQQPDTNSEGADQYFPDIIKPQPEEIILEWQAPSRPFKKHNKQYFTTIITIVLLLSLILFFAGQILPIAVVIAVAFLAYVMATIPPHTITNQLTTYGVRTEDNLYFWEELGFFWFEKKYSEDVLLIEVARFPNRLSLLIGSSTKEEVRDILSQVLLEERPPLTEIERLAKWLQKKVPLDLDS